MHCPLCGRHVLVPVRCCRSGSRRLCRQAGGFGWGRCGGNYFIHQAVAPNKQRTKLLTAGDTDTAHESDLPGLIKPSTS